LIDITDPAQFEALIVRVQARVAQCYQGAGRTIPPLAAWILADETEERFEDDCAAYAAWCAVRGVECVRVLGISEFTPVTERTASAKIARAQHKKRYFALPGRKIVFFQERVNWLCKYLIHREGTMNLRTVATLVALAATCLAGHEAAAQADPTINVLSGTPQAIGNG
jgi:hypothetical protein